ncbi:uncharacterized protein METZ01_LOCUS454361, partial [marine metagenome]
VDNVSAPQRTLLRLFILAALIALVVVFIQEPRPGPKAIDGSIDFTGWSFEDDGPVKLTGEWRIYRNEFIDPAAIASQPATERELITIPTVEMQINKLVQQIKGAEQHPTRLTLTLNLENLPEQPSTLWLHSFILPSATTYLTCGTPVSQTILLSESGRPTLPIPQEVWSGAMGSFSQRSPSCHLVVHIASLEFPSINVLDTWIGPDTSIRSTLIWRYFNGLVTPCILLFVGFYHLA